MNTRELGKVEHRGHQMNIPLRRPVGPAREARRARTRARSTAPRRDASTSRPPDHRPRPSRSRTKPERSGAGTCPESSPQRPSNSAIASESRPTSTTSSRTPVSRSARATSSIASPWPHPPRVQDRDPFPGARQLPRGTATGTTDRRAMTHRARRRVGATILVLATVVGV